jgi:hypothetical protein
LKLFKKGTAGYVAVTDVSHIVIVPELMEIYPEAKVVLCQRDPDKWYESFRNILDMASNPIIPILAWRAPGIRWFPAHLRAGKKAAHEQLADAGVGWGPGEYSSPIPIPSSSLSKRSYKIIMGSSFELPTGLTGTAPSSLWTIHSLTSYDSDMIRVHDKWIIDNVPKDKLLIMKVQDGWEPLCKFLGKYPIPDEPFPEGNDVASAKRLRNHIMAKLMIRWAVLLSTAGAAVYWTYRFASQSHLLQAWR